VAPPVHVASALREKLDIIAGAADALAAEFALWKSGGEDDHYDFGKDGLDLRSKVLYHVHLVPKNVPEAQDAWDKAWERYGKRTSDRYLFYAYGGQRLGWLLLDVIDDPGAHEVWEDAFREYRQQLEAWAQDFTDFGTLPK
jgi:hypothetical protein